MPAKNNILVVSYGVCYSYEAAENIVKYVQKDNETENILAKK